MFDLVIFGGPGSGKGTQSERIAERYGLHHISTGELLRDHIARGTELGRVADSYISRGQLIPDELMLQVLEDTLNRHEQEGGSRGVIFDGFPRNLAQAEAFDKMLERHGRKVDAVVGLEVDDDELERRMLSRGAATGRADDNSDTIKKRLDVYHRTTSPLRDFYTDAGKYMPIDGNQAVDDIFRVISQGLDDRIL